MAHLEVQPKKNSPWWLWLLLALVAIGLLVYFFRGCNDDKVVTDGDTTTVMNEDAMAPMASDADWNSVDFNSPATTDPDITDNDIIVSGNENYSIYSIGENILFDTDKSELQQSADSKLNQIATSLKNRYDGSSIGIYGSTDAVGSASANKELGAERAEAVKRWLTEKGNVDASRVSIHSLGENQPVATNETEAGRQENRNVRIVAFAK